MLFGGSSRAIYKTVDQGRSWRMVYSSDGQFHLGARIAIDRASPLHVVAIVPGGIVVSADGGESFELPSLNTAQAMA